MPRSKKNNKYKKNKNTKKLKKKLDIPSLSKKKRGVLMVMEGSLVNSHLLPRKDGKKKESPAYEIYTRINDVFEFTPNSYGFIKENICKSKNKWFKFVIFQNDDELHIFIINGSPINKHSVCMLMGLLSVSSKTEYVDIRKAVEDIELLRDKGIDKSIKDDEPELKQLNHLINEHLSMMPVIVAGSGTYDDEQEQLCINTKSGHYKPTLEGIRFAKNVFEKISGDNVFIQKKVDKKLLMDKYGDDYQEYSGICL